MAELKKNLGLIFLVFYGTGMILGAGIYTIIGKAAGIAGENVWLSFALAAVSSLLTALSYAELATMFPKAGAEYVYIKKALPNKNWVSFIIGCMVVFSGIATMAAVSMAFGGYFKSFIDVSIPLAACAVIVVCTLINIFGVRESAWVNALFTLIEISGLVLIVILGWNANFSEAFLNPSFQGVLPAAALVVFAFFGFENIVNLAEEAKDPSKDIPKAIFISLFVSAILYVLVSVAAISIVSPEELAQSDSPLRLVASKLGEKYGVILGAIALFAAANTALIASVTTSRILYGISKDSHLPKAVSKVSSKRQTPWFAALVVLVLALCFLPLGQVEIIASVSAFCTLTSFIAVNLTLIALRYKMPDEKRAFKVPLSIGKVPLLPILAVIVSVIFQFQFEIIVHMVAVGIAALAFGIYILNKKFGSNKAS